jgi:AcrR family transcriptional regulator
VALVADRQLAAGTTAGTNHGRVITYEDALNAGRRRFVATGRLSMSGLQRDLLVSRATLYRVVGSRDGLLGDVLWQLAARTLEMVVTDVDGEGLRGVDRLIEITRRFDELILGFEPLQLLLQREPVVAFRVLFTPVGRVHERVVEAFAELFAKARDAGEIALPFDVTASAYLHVRIGESKLYGHLLAGVGPDEAMIDRLRRTVLQEP